ncbi:hypothetical protein MSPP1_002926 [Malassezia sp. CBS 17886]|nr:hypothetical protein MSPP1_002926 [Malassezia sp. CBS 17886]
MAESRVKCIAIVSAHNAPLLVRVAPSEAASATKWHFLAHGVLDLLEERAAHGTSQYLGLLATIEDAAIYGFQTNTRVKFLLMLQLRDERIADGDVVAVFRALHAVYVACMSNPFAHVAVEDLPGYDPTADAARNTPLPLPNQDRCELPVASASLRARVDAVAGWAPGSRDAAAGLRVPGE